jgi:hypothetical protein
MERTQQTSTGSMTTVCPTCGHNATFSFRRVEPQYDSEFRLAAVPGSFTCFEGCPEPDQRLLHHLLNGHSPGRLHAHAQGGSATALRHAS